MKYSVLFWIDPFWLNVHFHSCTDSIGSSLAQEIVKTLLSFEVMSEENVKGFLEECPTEEKIKEHLYCSIISTTDNSLQQSIETDISWAVTHALVESSLFQKASQKIKSLTA